MTAPFAVEDFDHVVFRARDVRSMVAFYVETLGCAVERIAGELTQLRAGRVLIDIIPRKDDDVGCNVDHLCLTVAPFDAAQVVAWLRRNGVETGDAETRYGAGGFGTSVYLRDVEGNGLELRGAA